MFAGRLKFDAEGKFSLKAAVATGGFAGDWQNMGLGEAPADARPYLKQVYLSAKPVDGLELQFGGIGIEPNGTGIVGLSGAGFLMGERAVVRRADVLWFDRAAFTYGYLGALGRPNVWDRFHRLGQGNFRQAILEKSFAKRLTATAEFSGLSGAKTMTFTGHFDLGRGFAATGEVYRRMSRLPDSGFHAGLAKTLGGRVTLEGGYAAVDRNFPHLNADAFFEGQRWYWTTSTRLAKGLTMFSMFNRAVNSGYSPTHRTLAFVGLGYDVLAPFGK